MPNRLRAILSRLSEAMGFQRDWFLILIGAALGTLTALGAIAFDFAVETLKHAVQALGQTSLWLLLAAPFAGMALTGVLVYFFAADARGHGVPQVIRALVQRGGQIPARIGLVKVAGSILTVGSGGSAGTEGPIVQIGATIGSNFGRALRLERDHLRTMVGCGAAAGISSIFNAPIAGVFFVLEILLRDFSIKTFTPIVVASVFSAVTTQAILGTNEAIFPVPGIEAYQFRPQELPSFILLGAICGLVGVGFNRLLHKGEDIADRLPVHPLAMPLLGAALLALAGLASILLISAAGGATQPPNAPPIYFNGYETISQLLNPLSYDPARGEAPMPMLVWLLAALVVLKAIATTFTLASGGSGGVFAPSLFLGATAGAAVGLALQRLGLLPSGATPAAYALVGMAAVVAASTHAPLTAILILFELTRNIYVVLPIMLAAVVATVVAQLIDRDSIYTYKLRRAGILIGSGRDLLLLRRIPASDCAHTPLPEEPVYPSDPLAKLITLHAHHHVPDFPVIDPEGRYVGMVTGTDMRAALIDREAIPLLLVAELLRTDLPTVEPSDTLDSVLDKFARHDVASLCILEPTTDRPRALLTRREVMHRYQQELERQG